MKIQNMEEYRRIINEANEAKDRLARISDELEELGYHQKAKSAMSLVYAIEDWQRRSVR